MADLIWLESPSNPLLTVADLDTICAAPRKPGAILGVDNTFATPLNQRPLALGADVAVQSVTKFIGGHSDLLGGVVTVRDPNVAGRVAAGAGTRGRDTRHAGNVSCRPRRADTGAAAGACAAQRHGTGRAPRAASKRQSDSLSRAWRATRLTRRRGANSKGSARSSRSTCVATPPPPTRCAPGCS